MTGGLRGTDALVYLGERLRRRHDHGLVFHRAYRVAIHRRKRVANFLRVAGAISTVLRLAVDRVADQGIGSEGADSSVDQRGVVPAGSVVRGDGRANGNRSSDARVDPVAVVKVENR